MINNTNIKANVHIELRDKDGNLKEVRDVHNTIVALGCAYIADQLSDKGVSVMSHMAIGNDDDLAPACGDIALNNELGRVALTSTTQGAGGADNTVIYVATFGPTVGTGSLVEAGIFNDPAAGTMLCRAIYGVITKGAADTLTITWTLTFGSC